MTNYEKYKTAEERDSAFRIFCNNFNLDAIGLSCNECPLESEYPKCSFKWLELEYEEELLPCPFCGGEAKLMCALGLSWIKCKNCLTETTLYSSDSEAIEKWNRRVNNG